MQGRLLRNMITPAQHLCGFGGFFLACGVDDRELLAALDAVADLFAQLDPDGEVDYAVLLRSAAAEVETDPSDLIGVNMVYITRAL